MSGEGPLAERAHRSAKRSYIRIGRVIAGLFVVFMIANAWHLDLRDVASAGVSAEVGGAVIEFLLIIAIAWWFQILPTKK